MTDEEQRSPATSATDDSLQCGQEASLDLRIPLWSYGAIGLQAFLLLLALAGLVALRSVFYVDFLAADGWPGGWAWGLLTTIALAWGLVNLHWARRALRHARGFDFLGHLAIVLCSAVATVGLHLVVSGKAANPGPIIDVPEQLLSRAAHDAQRSEVPAEPGNARKGKAWFSLYCIACHGPDGNGVENLAPSLRSSDFIASADRASLFRVIKFGRAIDDPRNKSGKPMPPKGNNPDLSDRHIADIAEHLLSLYPETYARQPRPSKAVNGDAAAAGNPQRSSSSPTAERPNATAASPTELLSDAQQTSPRMVWLAHLSLWTHAVWLMAVSVTLLLTIVSVMRGGRGRARSVRGWFVSSYWGWIFATAGWLATWLSFSL